MYKKLLVIFAIVLIMANVSCGGSSTGTTTDQTNDGDSTSLGAELGNHVLEAKILSGGLAYAIYNTGFIGAEAIVFNLFSKIKNMTYAELVAQPFSYSFTDVDYVALDIPSSEGKISGNYTFSASDSDRDSIIIDITSGTHSQSGVNFQGPLSFSVESNNFSGTIGYSNIIGSDFVGNLTGSIETGNYGQASISGLDMTTGDTTFESVIMTLSDSTSGVNYVGAAYPDTSSLVSSCKIDSGTTSIICTLSGITADIYYYLSVPTGSTVEELMPENNTTELYQCANIGATVTMPMGPDGGDITFALNTDLHCTCPTCE